MINSAGLWKYFTVYILLVDGMLVTCVASVETCASVCSGEYILCKEHAMDVSDVYTCLKVEWGCKNDCAHKQMKRRIKAILHRYLDAPSAQA